MNLKYGHNGKNNNNNNGGANESQSVTLVSVEQLARYSSERFYLLSEISENAHATIFLCDIDPDPESKADNDTADMFTADTETTTKEEARYFILYFCWKPEVTISVETFVETVICEAVQKVMQSLEDSTFVSSNTKSSLLLPMEKENKQQSIPQQQHKLYIVVDRIDPLLTNTDGITCGCQTQFAPLTLTHASAGDLAKYVASHIALRHACQGITVGTSNHARAAPALERIARACAVGASDRRAVCGSSQTCQLTLVALDPDALLGLQSPGCTDAAQGVTQSLVTAEWNGQGPLLEFAGRAHAAWRRKQQLLPEPPCVRRRTVRRVSQTPPPPPERRQVKQSGKGTNDELFRRFLHDFCYDAFAYLLIGLYVWGHFRQEILWIAQLFQRAGLEDLVQYLREL
jgi:hypothetical protein